MIKIPIIQKIDIAFYILAGILVTYIFYGKHYLGGDWSLPVTEIQIQSLFMQSAYGWFYAPTFGLQQVTQFQTLGIPILGYIFGPEFLLSIIIFICISIMYFGLRKLIGSDVDIYHMFTPLFVTLIICSSALFLDYILMGWLGASLSFSFLPLILYCYIKSFDDNKYIYYSAILCSLPILQSQAIVWNSLLLLFLCISLFGKYSIKKILKIFIIFLILVFFLNSYWILNIILFPPDYISNSKLILSSNSSSINANLSLVNMVRGWGAIYNYQLETAIEHHKILIIISFLVPCIAFYALKNAVENKKFYLLLLLFQAIVLIIAKNRELLIYIPFSNAFRDPGRFSILASFALCVLCGIGCGKIVDEYMMHKKYVTLKFLCVFLIITSSLYIIFSGILTDYRLSNGRDIRLRNIEITKEIRDFENTLLGLDKNYKSIIYPIGGTLSSKDDVRFNGAFNEYQDIFASFSPIPGVIYINDRSFGPVDSILNNIKNTVPDINQLKQFSEMGIKYFIFRNDVDSPYNVPSKNLIQEMQHRKLWKRINISKTYEVYEASAAKKNIYNNDGKCEIEYKKIDPTLYHVNVKFMSKEGCNLVLNESYNKRWIIFNYQKIKDLLPISWGIFSLANTLNSAIEGPHVNNKWILNKSSHANGSGENRDIYILFIPQIVFYIGLLISLATLLFIILFRKRIA